MAPTKNDHAARLAAFGVTAADITAQGLRFWHADTEWSEPGESAGKPDRYQWRVYRGLRLSAGSNLRNSRNEYLRADAPWSVTPFLVPSQHEPNTSGAALPTVARGACDAQADARAAAEAAADAFLAALAPALDQCAAPDHIEANCSTCIESAFAAGQLSLIIDDAMPLGRAMGGRGWNFVGCSDAAIDVATQVRVVHVMSAHARGEIRGYVLTTRDGALRQRGPCYIGPWPVLDAAVLARVAGAKFVSALERAA